MAAVIVVFEPRNDRLRRTDTLRKLRLGEPRLGAKLMDLARHIGAGAGLFELGKARGLSRKEASVHFLKRD